MSLDDIWDEPVVASPMRAPVPDIEDELVRPSPAKRRRTTLFLSSESEDGDGSPSRAKSSSKAPPKTPQASKPQMADIDALFDDLDDDYDDEDSDDELRMGPEVCSFTNIICGTMLTSWLCRTIESCTAHSASSSLRRRTRRSDRERPRRRVAQLRYPQQYPL